MTVETAFEICWPWFNVPVVSGCSLGVWALRTPRSKTGKSKTNTLREKSTAHLSFDKTLAAEDSFFKFPKN